MMNKEVIKALFPDDIEAITISKNDYDRLFGELTYENIELQQENQQLKRQLEYIRSGEYLNQLKFERNMLEDIVQNGGVSKEDKEFIDMTHRNTELLEENKRLKEEYILLQNASDEYEDGLQARITRAIEYIGNKNIGIPRKTRDKAIKILGGDVEDE